MVLIGSFVSVLGIETQQSLCLPLLRAPQNEYANGEKSGFPERSNPVPPRPHKHTSLPDSGAPVIVMNRQTICVSPVMESDIAKLDQRPAVC